MLSCCGHRCSHSELIESRPLSADLDLFVGNAASANALYINSGNGHFSASTGGPAYSPDDLRLGNTLAVAWGDANNDGGTYSPAQAHFPSLASVPSQRWRVCCGSYRLVRRESRCQRALAQRYGVAYRTEDLAVARVLGAMHSLHAACDLMASGSVDVGADGSGGFREHTGSPAGTSTASHSAAWADIDNDGGAYHSIQTQAPESRLRRASVGVSRVADLDLFVGNAAYGQGYDELWINSASSALNFEISWFVRGAAYAVAMGDADGDGDLDLMVGSITGNVLWTNDGTGAFNSSSNTLPPRPSSSATASVIVWGNADGQGGAFARTLSYLLSSIASERPAFSCCVR